VTLPGDWASRDADELRDLLAHAARHALSGAVPPFEGPHGAAIRDLVIRAAAMRPARLLALARADVPRHEARAVVAALLRGDPRQTHAAARLPRYLERAAAAVLGDSAGRFVRRRRAPDAAPDRRRGAVGGDGDARVRAPGRAPALAAGGRLPQSRDALRAVIGRGATTPAASRRLRRSPCPTSPARRKVGGGCRGRWSTITGALGRDGLGRRGLGSTRRRDAGAGDPEPPHEPDVRVRVADTRRQPGARGDRCLIFDTCDFVRRVWSVPDDWDRMSPEALVALAETGVGGAEHERVPSWRPLSLDWRPSEW
jgi:hypothetical protein